MTARLEGRLALITGASRGLGAAVAKRYAREGAHVILVARTIGGLEEVDDAIKAEGGAATRYTRGQRGGTGRFVARSPC
jgi:short-subunit dehydrogenase